jgi:hypothetical protein
VNGLRALLIVLAVSACIITAAAAQQSTLGRLLEDSDPTAVNLLPDSCLSLPVTPQGAKRYVLVSCHLNPSAEQTFIFSRDGQLKGEIFGWELVTLANDIVVYQDSDTHFAATHPLGISVYDPASGTDKKIYPPMPYQPVRQAFIQRVAAMYKSRGDEWFREHQHPGEPDQFDSQLVGDVKIAAAKSAIEFNVQYGDPDNDRDPLPFKQLVHVTCSPLTSVQQIRCTETAR